MVGQIVSHIQTSPQHRWGLVLSMEQELVAGDRVGRRRKTGTGNGYGRSSFTRTGARRASQRITGHYVNRRRNGTDSRITARHIEECTNSAGAGSIDRGFLADITGRRLINGRLG